MKTSCPAKCQTCQRSFYDYYAYAKHICPKKLTNKDVKTLVAEKELRMREYVFSPSPSREKKSLDTEVVEVMSELSKILTEMGEILNGYKA